MNFHILTLFPEMLKNGLYTSITGRAIEAGQISVEAVNIRDFSKNKHKKVDDYPYGGGAGMLMQAQPVFDAYTSVLKQIPEGKKKRVIYVTPQGYPFTQRMAEEFAKNDELVFICGHYEGIDERVLEEVVTDYVSIGDYVLTGGELAAMVMIDAISRLIPGVLHNEMSKETESFHGELLEHPQYSRPEEWRGKRVPEVLLSGNQKKIAKWRIEASVERTRQRRPDLYEKYMALQDCKEFLMKQKLLHIDMIELINRGRAILVAREKDKILLMDKDTGIFFYTGDSVEFLQKLPKAVCQSIKKMVLHQRELAKEVSEWLHLKEVMVCYQLVYTQREKLSVSGLYHADGKAAESGLVIRPLSQAYVEDVKSSYELFEGAGEDEEYGGEYILNRIERGCMFGAFLGDELAGYIGIHDDGSIGMLHVLEKYRGRKFGKALQTYAINMALEWGWIPYSQVIEENEASIGLLKSLGLHMSKSPVVWIWKG